MNIKQRSRMVVLTVLLVLLTACAASSSGYSEPTATTHAVPAPPVFPLSIYPPTHPPIGKGSIAFPGTFACPSLSGLQALSSGINQAILASLNGLLSARSERQAETYADRAAWPIVAAFWAPGTARPKAALSTEEVEIIPARNSTYASVYQSLCGPSIIADSWLAIWCTSATTGLPLIPKKCLEKQPDLTNSFYFLDRNGHWLLWGVQGGA